MSYKLTINDTTVNKISGPVSMGMIEPTKEYLGKFPYAPIFILFGDIHGSAKNFYNEGKEMVRSIFYVEGAYGELHKTDREFKK